MSTSSSSSSELYSESSTSQSSSTSSSSSESIGNTSSSSSSSSSSSNSSSSSSWQYSTSSWSSSSSESIGNTSSSSSSSSSSSESSESIGNTSSSSSSSGEIWNQSKPLIFANSAISTMSVANRLAQAIELEDTAYSIGKVYCYLYSSKYTHSYNVHLSIYDGNSDGSPDVLLSTQTLDATTVNQDGWYSFEFNISGTTPDTRILTFVLWQDGGNEDNYVMWGYSVDETATYALFSDDNSTWTAQNGVVRALKVVGVFDLFDLDNYEVNSPPAVERNLVSSMNSNSSSYFNTVFIPEPSRIELDQPDLIVSFVVDSSGSMGWNDRFGNRTDFITSCVNRFVDYYPSNVVFDIVKFGSLVADAESVQASMGQVMSINLDLKVPNRTTYIFTTETPVFKIFKGSTYSHNGYTYTVFKEYSSSYTIAMVGDGAPLDEGTLTKTSVGEGDPSIVFRSVSTVSAESNYVVALGFKNLENGHVYNFAGISIDDESLSGIDTDLWQLLYPSSENPSMSLGINGPRGTESLDISSTNSLVARSPFGSELSYANVLSWVSEGDTTVTVSNITPFITDSRIDLVDREHLSANLIVVSNSGSTITFSPASPFQIKDKNYEGGMIQSSSYFNRKKYSGNTVQLYLRDTSATRNIVFFFQTMDGYCMEWDIAAHQEWYIYNLYWLGETALLPLRVFDKDGFPFANGTRIDLEVGGRADVISQTSVSYQKLTETANIGDTTVYVESLEGFTKDQSVTLTDKNGNIQTAKITELGEDEDGKYYVDLYPNVRETFSIDYDAALVPSASSSTESSNSPVGVALSMVDVTPIYTATALDPSLRDPYDPDPVPPSTSYEDLNNAKAYIREGSFNIPTIDGYGVIRILPITEDVLRTQEEKAQDTANLLRIEPSQDFVGQEEQATGDLDDIGISPDETATVENKDYTIETPVYLYNGEAESSMTTTAVDLTKEEFLGITIPGITSGIQTSTELWIKEYDVYPSISMYSKTNVLVAKQYFELFNVMFTPPYNLVSLRDDTSKIVKYWIPTYTDECSYFSGYIQTSIDGVYASQEDGSYTINYILTNKFKIEPSATLTVRVYSNKIANLENLAYTGQIGSSMNSEYFLNVQYPDITTVSNGATTVTEHLSEIDQWREFVQNNTDGYIDSTSRYNNISGVAEDIEMSMEERYGDTESYLGANNDSDIESLFYTNKTEWTYATQYDVYDTTIEVVDGKASFTLPANTIPSLIFVEATLSFNTTFEAIRGDMFVVANPVTIGPLLPCFLTPKDDITNELTSNITWMDGSDVIDNGVPVDLRASTSLIPSSSITDDGWARGMFIGPHAPYIYAQSEDSLCSPIYLMENVRVQVNHPSGYSTTVTRLIAWNGITESATDTEEFYFKVSDGSSGWADGSNATATVTSDLAWPENDLWINTYGGDPSGINRLLGLMQPNNQARFISGSAQGAGFDASGWLIPKKDQWDLTNIPSFAVSPLNKNVGQSEEATIWLSTGYSGESSFRSGIGCVSYPTPNPEGGVTVTRPTIYYNEPLNVTLELEAYDGVFVRDGVASPNIIATVTWKNDLITKNTFSNYPLPSVTFLAGTCAKANNDQNVEDPKPIDSRGPLDSCLEINSDRNISLSTYVVDCDIVRTDVYPESPLELNRHTHACVVDENGDGTTTSTIVLKGTVATHTHTITNYETDEVLSHSHGLRCVAITQINPMTDTGLKISINGYTVYDPTTAIPHDLGLNPKYFPTLPEGNRIVFNTVDLMGYTPSLPNLELEIEYGRDLTQFDDEAYEVPLFSDELNPSGPPFFTAETHYDTAKGFDIRVLAKFSSYVYENPVGVPNTEPEQLVDDGSRMTFEVIPYKPVAVIESGGGTSWDNSNVSIVAPDVIKFYIILKVKISIAAENPITSEYQVAYREFYIAVNSNLQWISGIKSLMPELSNDVTYVTTALTQIDSLGGSQLHDAVKEATQRIIQEQTNNAAYKQYEKVILLVTDGDENTSEYSLDQAVSGVNFIDGTKETPTLGIQLGKADTFSDIVMKKYAEKTEGDVYSSINLEAGEIENLVDFILENGTYGFNYGTYTNLLSLNQSSIPIEFRLGYVYLPTGTTIEYRSRYTTDGEQWSSWSEWYNHNIITTFNELDERVLQFQYEVRFFGNGIFETPILYGASSSFDSSTLGESSRTTDEFGNVVIGGDGQTEQTTITVDNNELSSPLPEGSDDALGVNSSPSLAYNKPQSFTVFFKPISVSTTDKEYVSSIHITHEATIPETSEIVYGLIQSNDLELEEYMVDSKFIDADTYTILLTRYNELLTTENYKTYYALNGRWPHSSTIEIYRFNSQNPDGILVNSAEYASNSITGEINFFNHQSEADYFTINVIFKPYFRLIAKITNYGQETAVLHHIGVIYNTTKRVPTDTNGNIIHKPISKRLT